MKVLIVGNGGREHALAWKLYQSDNVDKIYAAPGNDGMLEIAERVEIKANDIESLAKFAKEKEIGMTVVGPEEPLVAGIVDYFVERGIPIFGPKKQAALLEGSKAFAKDILNKYDIPTGEYEVFTDPDNALNYLENAEYPLVIKANGLAGGKGVIVASNYQDSQDAVARIMEDKAFGDAGDRIVVEDFIEGEEVSIFALTDGQTILPVTSTREHKAIFEGEEGPNTGGMGSYSPSPYVDAEMMDKICREILRPTLHALNSEGIDYRGVMHVGIILTESGPKVIDYNARFGDPETQVIMPLLAEDLIELMQKTNDVKLKYKKEIEIYDSDAVCVVLASAGYPLTYKTGYEIKGLENLKYHDDLIVFHSGTKFENGKYYTDSGRVIGMTVVGEGILSVIDTVYNYINDVEFKDMHYRTDIGFTISDVPDISVD
ncbi:Phosphoribosylamine--glycine ligase [Halanaerobium saccharolyticum subsp. saccharolyticum DSM 6643]|uniref:Phosphoribosylamine--glycine ligase n=1 Tax=Halanaerobium saccharolyticum subsp. saccharolyticum DSM 6643 TaxID=1293054 RepID=M5E1S8_9FIRM|nr:phosphoribosylamine--glycine ligase [Halanaerobium saccharolyticum]CCU79927.1 Phosphoribosylamine--glycine ligase [Halanaerobium saccharolyticum subsp. saccharolyticum DSM 6643]